MVELAYLAAVFVVISVVGAVIGTVLLVQAYVDLYKNFKD